MTSSNEAEVQKILSSLDPNLSSTKIYNNLIQIRTKHLKNESIQDDLIQGGIVGKIVSLLERPNSKIVDICLSILGNLMMKQTPKKQVRYPLLF